MLLQEIELTVSEYNHNWQFDSIYFGGGSPAQLSSIELKGIIHTLKEKFSHSNNMEITLEINPGENSLEELQSCREIGVNRASLGFQTLDSKLLILLTRTHILDDCIALYGNAREAGIENISIDMLYNIPGQTVKGWLNDLKTVVEMQPDHIAMYSLTAAAGTPFYEDIQNGIFSMPDAAIEGEMFRQGAHYLRDCGFTHYEISHFAKSKKECRHNLHYWKRDPYLAFGPSAHGFDGEKRYWNVASLEKYIKILSNNNLPIQDSEVLSSEDILNEIVINGLRTNLGIPTSCFDNLGDISIQKWESFLERVNGSLLLKPEYFHLADEIAADLMIW
jgi:oxygen-independent coproporphyrinogen-3 oxidase